MVDANHLKVYKSVNNLGGPITTTQITSATPNNLFTNVPKNELVTGKDYYACVYWKNSNTAESMDNFKLWLSNKSFPHDTTIEWGIDTNVVTSGYKYYPFRTFNGLSDFIQVGHISSLSVSNFSISFWFKTGFNFSSSIGTIVNKGYFTAETAGQNINFEAFIGNDNKLHGFFEESAGVNREVISSGTVNDDVWHFAIIYYDHVNLKIDLDNSNVGTLAVTTNPDNNTLDMFIGCAQDGGISFYNGNLDELRIWNRALNGTERSDLFTAGTVPSSGMVYENKFGSDTPAVAQTIADKYTAPTGITWKQLGTTPATPDFLKLLPSQAFPTWIHYDVSANAQDRIDDNELFSFSFDIPQGGTGSSGGGGGVTPSGYHYEPYGTFPNPIYVPDSASLRLTQFTVAAWFRTTHDYTPEEGQIVIKGIGNDSAAVGQYINYNLKLNNTPFGNQLECNSLSHDATYHAVFTEAETWNDGQWHFALVSYDGAEEKLHVDGVLKMTLQAAFTPEQNTVNLAIGGEIAGTQDDHFWHGDIDEVRIWNRALTDSEKTQLYSSGSVPSSGLVYENIFGGSGSGSGGSGGGGGNPPPVNANFKIAIAGDWGCENETDDVISLINSGGYNILVGVGDNAYASSSCWTSRFQSLKTSGKFTKSGYGNHEYSESGGVSPYKTFFGDNLTYQTFKYQNIFFAIFDTNISFASGSAQHTAMTNAINASLTDNTITWRIGIIHHPMFGADSDHSYNDNNFNQVWQTYLQNNGFDFVCSGHNHNWQRTKQVVYNSGNPTSPTVVASTSPFSRSTVGIIHVVTGTGGHDSGSALYALGSQPSFQGYQNRTNNGIWEIIASDNAQTLTCSFVNTGGDKFDTFVMTA